MSRNPWRRRAPPAAVISVSLLFAACGSPVGEGVKPISIGLAAASGTEVTVQGVTRVYQCFEGGLTAVLYFSDGSSGDFTSRVKWSSSNPGAVMVSNGDIPASDGSGFYAAGTLVPVTAGNSTVTAEYSTIKMQTQVSAGVPTGFSIRRVDQSVPTPVADVSLGVGTTQQFVVSAITDGVSRDVSSFAHWTVGGSVAGVTAGGVVSAFGAGGPTPLTASFLNCSTTVSTNLTVANINGIEIVPEFGADPLLLSNTEKQNVLADLDDGTRQDVSLQASLTSTDTSIAAFLSDSGATNVLQPVSTGAVTLKATLNNIYTAPERVVNVVSSTLTGISISPATVLLRASSDQVAYFKATGVFQNGQTQDVTRQVTWAVADTTIAGISNDKATAGFAVPDTSTVVGQTTVTATPTTTDSTATVTSATLTVDSVANPESR